MKNRKLRLLGSLVLPLFAVATASVSTYAWFQAQANVGISVAENSVSISVVAPDGVNLDDQYSYFIYYNSDEHTYSHTGDATGSLVEDHETNFVLVDSLIESSIHIVPGKRLTFGIRIDVNSGSPTEASLVLKGYSSKNKTTRKIITGKDTFPFPTAKLDDGETDRIIRVEEAIEIYGQINSTGAFDGPQDINDSFTDSDYDINDQQSTSDAKAYSNKNIVISSVDNLSNATTLYYFYTITLAEDDNETFYQEYVAANTIEYNTPVASSTEETRYFYKTTSGNSNCYEGLEFKITDLEITAE